MLRTDTAVNDVSNGIAFRRFPSPSLDLFVEAEIRRRGVIRRSRRSAEPASRRRRRRTPPIGRSRPR